MKRLRGQRGQALLETAVILPIVLLVSVSIFEFGRAYQVFQIMTNAAREGARLAVLPDTTDADVRARVQTYLVNGAIGNAASAVVNIDHTKTVSVGGGTAPATQVSVNYPFSFIVLNPVARLVVRNSSLGGAFTMTTTALMRNE